MRARMIMEEAEGTSETAACVCVCVWQGRGKLDQ